jgi:hypothetical protein
VSRETFAHLGGGYGRWVEDTVDLPWGIERDEHSRWAMFHDPAGNLIELVEFGE